MTVLYGTLPLRDRRGMIRAYTVVDVDIYREIIASGRSYYCNPTGYAERSHWNHGKKFNLTLHREILGLQKGDPLTGDHRNGDRLDNRRENLRVVTKAQNLQNITKRTRNRSGFRGVSVQKHSRKFRAQGRVNGRNHHIGCFDTAEEAGRAAAEWRKTHLPFSERS